MHIYICIYIHVHIYDNENDVSSVHMHNKTTPCNIKYSIILMKFTITVV